MLTLQGQRFKDFKSFHSRFLSIIQIKEFISLSTMQTLEMTKNFMELTEILMIKILCKSVQEQE